MSGVLIPQVRYVVLNPNGDPMPFAQIRAFLAGTATPQPLYTTAALNVPHAIPVEADGDGLFPAIFTAPTAIKIEVSDADGVLLYNTDTIVPGNLLTGKIASDQETGHFIGELISVGGSIQLEIGGAVVASAADLNAIGLVVHPQMDASVPAASIQFIQAVRLALEAILGAAGTPNIETLALTVPNISSGGAVPARSAGLVVGGYPTVGLERYALIVTSGPFRANGAVQFSTSLTPAAIAANTDNYAPTGIGSAYHLRISSTAPFNLTGIDSWASGSTPLTTGNAPGRQFLLTNIGANTIMLMHDATSTAANRFACPNGANFALTGNLSVHLHYDTASARWWVVT